MKIRRTGSTGSTWFYVGDFPITAKSWRRRRELQMDITIDKSGTRHSEMQLEFSRQDVSALALGLARGNPAAGADLAAQLLAAVSAEIRKRDRKIAALERLRDRA